MGNQVIQTVRMGTDVSGSSENTERTLVFQTQLLSCVQEAIAAVDADYVITYWNPIAEKLTGISSQDAVGNPAGAILHLASASGNHTLEDIISGRNCDGEFMCRLRSGRTIIILLHTHAFLSAKGSIQSIVASFRDITDEKLRIGIEQFFESVGNCFSMCTSEREILKTTAKQIADHFTASEGVLFVEVDEEKNEVTFPPILRSRNVNTAESKQSLTGMFGAAALRQLKTGCVLAISDFATDERTASLAEHCAHKEARSELIAPYIEGSRLRFVIIARHGEPRAWRPDETVVLKVLAERIFKRIILARTEERLAFQANLLSNVQEAVFAVDRQLTVVYWNKAAEAMFGWRQEETLGQPVGVLASTGLPCLLQGSNSEFADERRFEEATCYHKDSHPIETEVLMRVQKSACGKFDGAIISMRDITQRKRDEAVIQESERVARNLAQKLEEKNKFITDFFINVSHEFKTPLTIMMLGLELMERKIINKTGCPGDLARNISVMKQNSYRLNRLVSNLLDITKLDAGFMEPRWETTDIISLLKNLSLSTETYARQKALTLRFHANIDSKHFCTDSFMLERIMLNLISNAIKHTPPGGRIDVRCKDNGEAVTISVRDTGEGIPEEKKKIIFDRFSQVDTSLARASEGSGIGLALTKSFVELMGGRIWFTSTAGSGSEFFVELPAVHREDERSETVHGTMQLDKRVQIEFSDIGLSMG